MFVPSVVEIGPVVLEKKMHYRYFVVISPWKRAWPFMSQLRSLHQGCFVLVWLKLAQWFLRKRFLNFVYESSLFRSYLPWKRAWSFLWKTEIPFTKGCFVPSLVEIGPVVLEKMMKMWSLQTDIRTDDRWSEKFTLAFSSGEVIKKRETVIYLIHLLKRRKL